MPRERSGRRTELEQERELLQRIIDRMPVMITVYEPSTRVLRLNPEFERVTGWSAADAQNVDLMEQVYPDPAYREQVREYMESVHAGWREISMRTRSGELVETSWANLHLSDDTRVGIGLDIRERKRLEDLQKEFIANITHELRNPLTSIRGLAQMMRRRESYDSRAIELILTQTRALERLVEDLQDVAHFERSGLGLNIQKMDLLVLAREAVDEARATSEQHRITLDASEEPLVGVWDPERLSQIFRNLLGNAIKYSPEGGVIVVRIRSFEAIAEVAIQDSGLGIAPEDLPRLFQRFSRVTPSATGVHGLGLGLYVTRELVEAHGGWIRAESEGPGRGSTFRFTLPLD
ncbi:MAG: PAS domain S-box protein [Chloroflexi bacterium]|nr:PAS domain S-box protein [Chloroflexota bacterium]MBV9545613.1 PAS domain S-box protein [Chloroflexota bacterium]